MARSIPTRTLAVDALTIAIDELDGSVPVLVVTAEIGGVYAPLGRASSTIEVRNGALVLDGSDTIPLGHLGVERKS